MDNHISILTFLSKDFRSSVLKLSYIFLWIIFFLFPCWATTYYVDMNGNDNNPGTSHNLAFRTIQRAADIMTAGDSCLVQPGVYDERVWITTPGNWGAPIIFKAEGPAMNHGFTIIADYIHIIGFEVANTIEHWREGAGVHVEGKYCEVRNNFIHDVYRIGIRIFAQTPDSPSTSYCLVKGNRIERAGLAGIEIYGRNNLIEENEISHTLQNNMSDADGMRFLGSGHIFRKNYIHDILLSDPGNISPHIDCFQTWGPAYDITFEQNLCENPNDDMQGFMIQEINSPVRDLTVINNIMSAFRILNVHDCENITIVNNTFTSELTYTGISGYGIELHNSPYARVLNNIFYDVGRHVYPYLTKDSGSEIGLQVGYNCIYMSDGQPPAGNPWENDLWQIDPKFVDIENGDFHLQQNSQLINSGISFPEVTNDFEDVIRPQGNGFDIGVFEYDNRPSAPSNLRIRP